MRRRRGFALVAGSLALTLFASSSAAIESEIGDDVVSLSDAFKALVALRKWRAQPDPRVQYAYAPLCNVNSQYLTPEIEGSCAPPDGTVVIPGCGEDRPVQPLWRRTRSTTTSNDWTPWKMLAGWACPDELLPPFSQVDFRQLRIEPLTAHRQPSGDEVLVNKPLIVYADSEHRTFRTDLFGFGIDVDAYPVEYMWDFGDGRPLTTTDPGSPYPAFDVTHTYGAELTNATVTLTTTWKGTYRVDEDPKRRWLDIEGTAFTTTTFDAFDVVELRSRLVG